jgi:alkylation response protein AidB-like acyl-CoA dehydrogenase
MFAIQILKKLIVKGIPKVQRSSLSSIKYDLFNPTEQHAQLRHTVQSFCESEVSTQGLEWDRDEKFNIDLFRKLGDLGLLGITVAEEYGGSGQIICLQR